MHYITVSPGPARHARVASVFLCCALAACSAAPDDVPGARVAIAVAPLSLDGIGDAEYVVTVQNGSLETVWTKTLRSSAYGDGAGDVSYVGPCDTDDNDNTVTVELTGLFDDADAPIGTGTYHTPGAVSREVRCEADRDTAVAFDITVARAAQQGFFDVALQLDQVFCSAKLDCQADDGGPLELLHTSTGARGPTAVLGFTCVDPTAAADTVLYLDDLEIECDGAAATLDPTAGPGVLSEGAGYTQSPSGSVLFSASVFRGEQDLNGAGDQVYWNVALGLAGASDCHLTVRGTASRGGFDSGSTPEGTTYPFILWDLDLTLPSGDTECTRHALEVTPPGGVEVGFTDIDTPLDFDHGFTGTDPVPFSQSTLGPSRVSHEVDAVIGADGLPFIVFSGETGRLQTARCGNLACSSAEIYEIPHGAEFKSVILGNDGLPFITRSGSDYLRAERCVDASCTSASTTTLRTETYVDNVLAVGPTGLPMYVYVWGGSSRYMTLKQCDDADCSTLSGTYSGSSMTGSGRNYNPALALGSDDLPVLSWAGLNTTSGRFERRVGHCDTAICANATESVIDTDVGTSNLTGSMAIGADGFPLIVYYSYLSSTQKLTVTHCEDVGCTSWSSETLASPAHYLTDVTIGSDGLPVIAWSVPGTLYVTHCGDALCTPASNTTNAVDTSPELLTAEHKVIVIGSDGYPFIAYVAQVAGVSTRQLRVIHCDDVYCTP